MPAEDRARKPGALPSAPDETGVSMRALLASCAAADAVSTPPSDVDGQAAPGHADVQQAEDANSAEPDGEDEPSRAASGPQAQRDQDAA